MRTFKTDTSGYVGSGGSVIGMAAKQEKIKNNKNNNSNNKNIKMFLLFISFLLLIGSGYFVFSLINKSVKKEEQEVFITPKPILVSDDEYEVNIIDLNNSIENILKLPLKEREFVYIPILKTIGNQTQLSVVDDLFKSLKIDFPDFISDIDDRFMYSLYNSKDNFPVLLFKINSYSHVFVDMLEWEKYIYEDLEKILNLQTKNKVKDSFYDIEIRNNDVRVFDDVEGNHVLYYSIVNRKYLIITSNENALKEVFRRLSSFQFLND